jgi:hypothetical protein
VGTKLDRLLTFYGRLREITIISPVASPIFELDVLDCQDIRTKFTPDRLAIGSL